ncbi:pyruvate kinase 2, cytosolic-like [Papaver somniferum]|uniref:pyruvate kinase 2, cytosolic-like n=1 Tax=Papaver somniferum TaxID=3469 RepID=UPI000E7035B9|nr:pyruvate kinase 2, cytosolic-like [Papaver somniferum]
MLDTIGPELQVLNKSEKSIALKAESSVVLTPDQDKEATSDVFPINYDGLAKAVKKGDTIFLGQYLFTGSETTSVWLEICTLPGSGAADMYSNCKQRIYTRICKQWRKLCTDIGKVPVDQQIFGFENSLGKSDPIWIAMYTEKPQTLREMRKMQDHYIALDEIQEQDRGV